MNSKRVLMTLVVLALCWCIKAQSTQRSIPKTAAYGLRFKSVLVADKYIYYIEATSNNAVMGIDRKTGLITTIIPGIDGIYEGARDKFTSIKGNDQLLYLKTWNKLYAYTPGKEKPWLDLGNHVEVVATSPDCFKVLLRERDESYVLFDFTSGQQLLNFSSNYIMPQKVFVASNGCMWYKGGNNLGHIGLKRIDLNGQEQFYDMWNMDYIVQARRNGGVQIADIVQKGDSLFLSCGRRIYCVNMLSDGIIEEYAKVPPTEDNSFGRFGIDSKGNILADGKHAALYRVGKYDSPINLGKNPSSGLKTFDFTEIWLNLSRIVTDVDNNFVIYRTDGTKIYVYNPNGVKGFTQTRGKVTKK